MGIRIGKPRQIHLPSLIKITARTDTSLGLLIRGCRSEQIKEFLPPVYIFLRNDRNAILQQKLLRVFGNFDFPAWLEIDLFLLSPRFDLV